MKNKIKNPYFWISLVAVIFAAGGVDYETLTSWSLLYQSLLSILSNPVAVVAVLIAVLGVWNDNSTPGLDTVQKSNSIRK